MSNRARIHVAVGVIVNAAQEVLIAHRAQHLHQGGLWEFPGGKVETNEGVEQALKRELLEELNITVQNCAPLLEIAHDYGDKSVLLDVWLVREFSGKPQGLQGQPLQWVKPSELFGLEFPAANAPIVEAVSKLFES